MSEEADLRAKAHALGLDKLTDDHLAQFGRALAGMARLLQRLPRGLPVADEPAHVFRAKGAAR